MPQVLFMGLQQPRWASRKFVRGGRAPPEADEAEEADLGLFLSSSLCVRQAEQKPS